MLWLGPGESAHPGGTERRGQRSDRTGRRARRGDPLPRRRTAARARRPGCGGPRARPARRRRRHPARPARRAGLRPDGRGGRPAAGHDRGAQRPVPAAARARGAGGRGRDAPRRRRDPGRAEPGLVPVGGRGAAGHGRRRPAGVGSSRPGPGAGCCSSTPFTRPGPGVSATSATCASSPPGPAPSTAPVRCCSTRCTPSPRYRRCSRPRTRRPAGASARRWRCGLTDLPVYSRADPATRAEVDALRPETTGGRIEHDRVWAAKRAAAELLWRSEGRPEPRDVGTDLLAVRHLLRAGRALRRSLEPLAAIAAPPGRAGGRRGPSGTGSAGRLPRLAAAAGAAAARRGQGGGPGGRRHA